MKSRATAILRTNEKVDEEEVWRIFKNFRDKDFSFTDCTSFALMKREAITASFTFDKHFKQCESETIPK